jgi:hypothetical protein
MYVSRMQRVIGGENRSTRRKPSTRRNNIRIKNDMDAKK